MRMTQVGSARRDEHLLEMLPGPDGGSALCRPPTLSILKRLEKRGCPPRPDPVTPLQ